MLLSCSAGCDADRELQHLAVSGGLQEWALGTAAIPAAPLVHGGLARHPWALCREASEQGVRPPAREHSAAVVVIVVAAACSAPAVSCVAVARQRAAAGGWGRRTWGQHVLASWQGSLGGRLACVRATEQGQWPAQPGNGRLLCWKGGIEHVLNSFESRGENGQRRMVCIRS